MIKGLYKKKVSYSFLQMIVILLLSACSALRDVRSTVHKEDTGECTVYQIPFDYESGWILVKARLNWSPEEYVFVLDTGSTITSLSRDLFGKFGFSDIAGQRGMAADITGAIGNIQFGRIHTVSIGDVAFKDIEAGGIDTDTISHHMCERVDGFIGSNMIKDWILQIDYRSQTITFAKRKECLPTIEASYRSKFLFSEDGSAPPRCWCIFNGKFKKLITLDTGNASSIVIPSDMFEKTGQTLEGEEGMKAWGRRQAGILGTIKEAHYTKVTRIEIGSLTMEDVSAIVADYAFMTIGNGFFQNFLMRLDYPHREVIFAPYEKLRRMSQPSFFGFLWSYTKGNAIIDWLYNNSPASDAGIELGDEIISINGQQIPHDLSHEQLCEIRKSLSDVDTLELVLKRKGAIIETSIRKR